MERDEAGKTALMLAAIHGNVECVRILSQYLEDVLLQDKDGLTALMYAEKCFRVHEDTPHNMCMQILKQCLSYLTQCDANVDTCSREISCTAS